MSESQSVKYYVLPSGKCPFIEWLDGCDFTTKKIVLARVSRLRKGLIGDAKYIGFGVSELRIHHGGGIRIYFAKHHQFIFIVLCAGNKHSQPNDILKAIEYWQNLRRIFR